MDDAARSADVIGGASDSGPADAVNAAPIDESPHGSGSTVPGESHAGRGVSESHEVDSSSIIEAVLFSADVPLPAARLAQIVGVGGAGDVRARVDELNRRYAEAGASFRVEEIAKGFQLLTLPVYNRWIAKLHQSRADSRLSQAALETLAIVAYKQPALRADIESVRGVAVGDVLNRLREMNLVRIVGRAEEIGRPLLYGTTTRFLEVFGLSSLNDLPKLDPDQPDRVPALIPAPPPESSTPVE